MNQEEFLENGFIVLRESAEIKSPVGVLHYNRYSDKQELKKHLNQNKDVIQCIVSKDDVPFGKAQNPDLWDYSDGVDTIRFILDAE